MKATDIKKLIGRKVLVTHRGLILTGTLTELRQQFGRHDAMVLLPNNKKPTRFWAEKVKAITNENT